MVGTSNLGEPTDYLDELQKDLHKNVSLDYHIGFGALSREFPLEAFFDIYMHINGITFPMCHGILISMIVLS